MSLLRQLRMADCLQRNLLLRLRQHGCTVRVTRPDPAGRYLAVHIDADGGEIDGWLELASWLAIASRQWGDLAWACADEVTVLACFQTLAASIDWQVLPLRGPQVSLGSLARPSAGRLLALQTPAGELLFKQWPPSLWPAVQPICTTGLCLPLQLRVTCLWPRPRLLARLETGDLLLLGQPVPCLCLGQQALFNVQWCEEGIMLTEALPQVPSWQGRMEGLPVQVGFGLPVCQLTLAELNGLAVGQILPLPADARQRVILQANGVTVAQGELVEVDQQLAVEIQRTFITGS